jgi:hypothetical protein
LFLHIPFQLEHLRGEHQVNRFMGCDNNIEVAFKELKSGLHLGQMQVTKQAQRVEHALLLPVLAYLLLLRLYGPELSFELGCPLGQLKQRFIEEVYQEQHERSEQRWSKKLDQLRAAA